MIKLENDDWETESLTSTGSTDRICTAALGYLKELGLSEQQQAKHNGGVDKLDWDQDDTALVQLFLNFRRKVKQLTGEHKSHKKMSLDYTTLTREHSLLQEKYNAQNQRLVELEEILKKVNKTPMKIKMEETFRKKRKLNQLEEEGDDYGDDEGFGLLQPKEKTGGIGTALNRRLSQSQSQSQSQPQSKNNSLLSNSSNDRPIMSTIRNSQSHSQSHNASRGGSRGAQQHNYLLASLSKDKNAATMRVRGDTGKLTKGKTVIVNSGLKQHP
jgi:hypothetical protein